MTYTIVLTKAAERGLVGIPRADQKRIARRIDALAEDPRPDGVRKLQGAEDTYRIRVGDYRVLYEVADAVITITITIIRVAHRRDAYRY